MAACAVCCYAMWCPNCASFGLRKQALHNDMKRYICCNGDCPCSGETSSKAVAAVLPGAGVLDQCAWLLHLQVTAASRHAPPVACAWR